jgi:methyltransferase (TIGR00027 family)
MERDERVGTTADGCVVLRASPEAGEIGVHDPYAHLFLSDEGRNLAGVARQVDRCYVELNLSRFKRTTARLAALASEVRQLLMLGAGADCRALWLNELRTGRVPAFEVDTPPALRHKAEVLRREGVPLPEWDRHVPMDLREEGLLERLAAAGYRESEPTLVLAEGLFFFLPAEATRRLLDPASLRLAAGSRVLFDLWTDDRVELRNRQMKARVGVELFHRFPISGGAEAVAREMRGWGYREVAVQRLEELATRDFGRPVEEDPPASSLMVEAAV